MNRLARIAIVAALFTVCFAEVASAQQDPNTISNRYQGVVTIFQDTNGTKTLYLPDASWVSVNSLGTNSGPITVTTVTGNTLTFTTGAIGTVNSATINNSGTLSTTNAIVRGSITQTAGSAILTNLSFDGYSASIITNNLRFTNTVNGTGWHQYLGTGAN